jgi:hypothetical protein
MSLITNQGLIREQKQQQNNYAFFSFPPKLASQNETKLVKNRLKNKTYNH